MTRNAFLMIAVSFFLLVSIAVEQSAAATSTIKVTLSRESFNPTLGEKIDIAVSINDNGILNAVVLDRDGVAVRTLATGMNVEKGIIPLSWDGRNNAAIIVPNEAYSLKVDLVDHGKTQTYFPAMNSGEMFSITDARYSREDGNLSYRLPSPSRVHIQAAMVESSPVPRGPVLSTIANAEPRGSGSVLETWRGMDVSGTIYVPDLPHFVLAIAAWPLPENSMIVTGGKGPKFIETVQYRTGRSLLKLKPSHHHHGLTALQDESPRMDLKPENATWDAAARIWIPRERTLRLTGKITGPSASAFVAQPGQMFVFADTYPMKQKTPRTTAFTVNVPLDKLPAGEHIVAVNWGSDYGPVAVQSLRVKVEASGMRKKKEGGNVSQ